MDLRHGNGRMMYRDKSEYCGGWKMDLRHGKGVYRHPTKGISYSGQWECNLPHGEGELKIKSQTEDYQYRGECQVATSSFVTSDSVCVSSNVL